MLSTGERMLLEPSTRQEILTGSYAVTVHQLEALCIHARRPKLAVLITNCLLVQFPNDPGIVNVSHIFKSVSFGPSFPGQVNPLDGVLSLPNTVGMA